MEMFRFGDFAGWLIEVRKRTIGGTAATPHKKRGYIVRCNPLRFLERETGFEPATFSLGILNYSVFAHFTCVPKVSQCIIIKLK